MATDRSNMDTLPEECVCKILTYTSPPDACRFSMVSSTLRSAADFDVLWRTFLPSDYHDIVSRTLNPLTLLQSSSYKHLFCSLCCPLLLDRGNMIFKLDKSSGKKSYILSARELSITWSSDPLYWSWRSTPESRILRLTLCGVGVILLLCGITVLACIKQDDTRHSFGHSGGFACPFVPFLPAACILINTYLLIDLGAATWLRVSVWMLIGVLIYLCYGRTHSSLLNATYVPSARADEIHRTQATHLA